MVSCNLSSNAGHFQSHVEQLSKSIGDTGVRSDKSKEQSAVDLLTSHVFKQFKDCLDSALKSVGEGTACRANILFTIEGLDFLGSGNCSNLLEFWNELKDVAKDVDIQMPSFKSKDPINLQAVSTSSIPNSDSILISSTAPSVSAAVPKNIFSKSSSSGSASLAQLSSIPVATSSSSSVERHKVHDDWKEPSINLIFPVLSATTSSTSSVETVGLTYLNNLKMNLNSWKVRIAKSEDRASLSRIVDIIQTITEELESVKKLVEPKSVVVAGSTSPILPDLIVGDIRPLRTTKTEDELVYMCLKQMKNYFADHENFDDKYLGEDAKRLISDISYLKVILKEFETQVRGRIEAINQAKSVELAERAVVSSGSK